MNIEHRTSNIERRMEEDEKTDISQREEKSSFIHPLTSAG
jgi:hypothetical protein